MINNPIIYKIVKDSTNHRKKINRGQFLAVNLSPTFPKSGKQDSFWHILKSSAGMYKSVGSQFFRTTTEIQSGLGAFDELRFVMNFLTIFIVTEI